ncbi:DUF1839 family protein [Ideonella sp.]|jgi:hypothetical protein|uniref:DUF1839 family protein n=1 Tax=Ideonella sp. TaxID=1929293 RepID=UPI0037C0E1ED
MSLRSTLDTLALNRATALPGLDTAHYQRHALHGEGAVWPEKNCYADLWIELLHAMDLDPHAMLGVTLPLDFEGDQWTFFKPSHDELRRYYGLDVQELTLWRPLLDHALEHLSAGKLISVEADAYWLPDVAGTDYRQQHSKTTIVLADIDVAAKRLVYFHNAGCYALEGEDFDRTFRLGQAADPNYLPLFAELIRSDRRLVRTRADLQAQGRAQLSALVNRCPRDNPIRRFGERLHQDLPWLRNQGLAHYHVWAFAGTRQMGAGFELAAAWLRWLELGEQANAAAQGFHDISLQAKTLILKGARAVMSNKPTDLGPLLERMAEDWDHSMANLRRL